MNQKKGPVITGLALYGGLVLVLIVAFGGSLVSAAGVRSMQPGTATPAASVPPTQTLAKAESIAVTDTVSGDPTKDLTTAAVELHAGYIMDPYLMPVIGKTDKAASEVVKGCNGFLGATPSAVVNWSGKTDQLNVFIYSDDDAVLAIQKPDGSFICNDDAGARTIDPLLTIKDPAPGAYKIHVGAASKDRPALGFLGLTQAPLDAVSLAELDLSPMLRRHAVPKVEALQQLDPRALLTGREAIFGSADLQIGFKPVQGFVAGGGDIAALRIEDQKLTCAGYVSAVPSYSFTWTGSPQAIRLFVEALKDTSLAVVTPDQKVLCGMNATTTNLNPVVDIASPTAGQYYVYVASMQPDTVVGGKLTITGDVKATPTALAPAGQ